MSSRARAIAAEVTCKVSIQPLCVRDDADWARMVEAMGRPDLLRDTRFASAEQRRLVHDEFDLGVADDELEEPRMRRVIGDTALNA
jgi:crotonobetainyl-CoA:carnitine CoA-transferase CaiB-like acyl-CoA transferase